MGDEVVGSKRLFAVKDQLAGKARRGRKVRKKERLEG